VLSHSRLVGFVATAKPAEARSFYQGVLGLALVEEGPFALVFDAKRHDALRVQIVRSVSLVPYTALGRQVEDIRTTVRALAERGVLFERYDGLVQDGQGIWTSPDGSRWHGSGTRMATRCRSPSGGRG
jgi:catechol 2,3-dioxygenase-like lactoylglutathione lyase family enzyme